MRGGCRPERPVVAYWRVNREDNLGSEVLRHTQTHSQPVQMELDVSDCLHMPSGVG